MSFCDTRRGESALVKPVNQNPERPRWKVEECSCSTSASAKATCGSTKKLIHPRDNQSRRERGGTGNDGQIRPGVSLKRQKENENSGECRKKTNENRDERNQDSWCRASVDPLCQQSGDTDFSPFTVRGERGRTRCFHHRWGRFQHWSVLFSLSSGIRYLTGSTTIRKPHTSSGLGKEAGEILKFNLKCSHEAQKLSNNSVQRRSWVF